jgi:hypothetical protein
MYNERRMCLQPMPTFWNIIFKVCLDRLHNLSIQCQLDIFYETVKPILLYGCETWGFWKNDIIERVHLKFCKLLLHVKTSTPNFMIYGELGRYRIDIDIKVRMISYWSKLILGNQSKISSLYKLL